VSSLSEEHIAERRVQREAKIAEARRTAFRGAARLPLREVVDGLPIDGIVYAGADFLDRLIVVTSTSDPAETYAGRDVSPGWASFPHSVASQPYPVDITTVDADGSSSTVRVAHLPVAYPDFQPLPDGTFIVVGSRCHFTDEGPERNAVVLDADGAIVRDFCLGDGISDVQTTPSGQIWAGYGDEGVFGNYGWGNRDGPEPLGRSGLVRWSPDGDRVYEFQPPDGCPSISDCYALNVVGEEAWACYYTDFPVVHVRSAGSVAAWTGGVAGLHSLAVLDAERAGFVGGYDGLFDRLVMAGLRDDRVDDAGTTFQLVAPDGSDLPREARVFARGHRIHALTAGCWLTLDLVEVATT
jgi:hypothetical protein